MLLNPFALLKYLNQLDKWKQIGTKSALGWAGNYNEAIYVIYVNMSNMSNMSTRVWASGDVGISYEYLTLPKIQRGKLAPKPILVTVIMIIPINMAITAFSDT